MRICSRCDGKQLVRVDARSDVPPKNAAYALTQFGAAIGWLVWCSCGDGFVGEEDLDD